jgi:uncharacterized protein (TIGR03790 family)
LAEEIDRAVYELQIQAPIAGWLRQNSAQDRILYIVLTKGIPLRVKGTPGKDGTTASVDSELTALYARFEGYDPSIAGRLPNLYYLGSADTATPRIFSHADVGMYLVTRLDGFTVEDVFGLIDRGAAPVRRGRIVLDGKVAFNEPTGNEWLKAAAGRLAKFGFGDRVVFDETSQVLSARKDVLGYYSWGSNDPAIRTRRTGHAFVAGAIAGMYVSTDGRTFKEPPDTWKIGTWTDRTTFFGGSPQSLTGDLIREGVTGVAGHVAEPLLDATIRPDILFPAYLTGFNLAEAFYLAMPYVSWQTVVIGDPLCAPFPRKALAPDDIDKGIDPETELPALLSTRRLKALTARGTPADAAKALMRAEARSAKGDTAGGMRALEEATAADPKLVAAHLLLGSFYDKQKEYDKAIERYRAVLAQNADNVVALNNLAYALAVVKGQPAEAIGHAERAVSLTGGRSPEIADTLAWIQHLQGRDREAVLILERVVKAAPARGEFRLHAAVVYAALGRREEAAAELAEAVRLNPELEASDEVKALRLTLK